MVKKLELSRGLFTLEREFCFESEGEVCCLARLVRFRKTKIEMEYIILRVNDDCFLLIEEEFIPLSNLIVEHDFKFDFFAVRFSTRNNLVDIKTLSKSECREFIDAIFSQDDGLGMEGTWISTV